MSEPGTVAARRLLVCGYSEPAMVPVIGALSERLDWEPVYWLGHKNAHATLVEQAFPAVTFHGKEDALARRAPAGLRGRDCCAIEVARRLAGYEATLHAAFLRTGQRRLGLDFRHEFYTTLAFWAGLFDAAAPEVAIFKNVPKHFYEYVLYVLCRSESVPVIAMVEDWARDLYLPAPSYEQGLVPVRQRYEELLASAGAEPPELPPHLAQDLRAKSDTYDAAMEETFRQKYRVDADSGRLKQNITLTRKIREVLSNRAGRDKSWYLEEMATLPLRWWLRRSYEARTSEVDLEQPYILVALHSQPEKSTIPMGGEFVYQLLMVDLLSRLLPEGWLLYVKEHPSQLMWYGYVPRFRTRAFYDDLLAYDNVRLVAADLPSDGLVARARAVATLTGTIGWEAINRGVPAIVMGHAWYRYCEGTFVVTGEASCREALDRIAGGYRPDTGRIPYFLKAVTEKSVCRRQMRHIAKTDSTEAAARYYADRLIDCMGLSHDYGYQG